MELKICENSFVKNEAAQWCSGWSDGHTKLRQLSNGSSSLTINITEGGKRCHHVKANQFARKAFSCLYIGLIVVRINI